MFFVDVAIIVALVIFALMALFGATDPDYPQRYRIMSLLEVLVLLGAAVRIIAATMSA